MIDARELVHPDVPGVYKCFAEVNGEQVEACEVERNGWISMIKCILIEASSFMQNELIREMVKAVMNKQIDEFNEWNDQARAELKDAEELGDDAKVEALDCKIDAWQGENSELFHMWRGMM